MIPVRPPYLFDPALVEARVASLPHVAELIHSKKRGGERSEVFPTLEKTDREILRILGRSEGYPHLDALLETLEWCLERNWDAHQLGTKSRGEFASLMSDLATAEHSLLRGFSIKSPVGLPDSGRKPDLYLAGEVGDVIVEVFRPRELRHFHNFEEDVSRLFNEAEIRLDYEIEINPRLISPFDDDGRLISPPHPVALDDALGVVGDELLERLATRLEALTPAGEVQIHEEWPEANLRIECDLRGVAESDNSEPLRCVCVGKSFGGYEPTGMLRRLTEPIIGKAKKRQAGKKGDATRVLACDVSQAIVAVHLAEEVRGEGYAAVLSNELGPLVGEDYDVIALCRPVDGHVGGRPTG